MNDKEIIEEIAEWVCSYNCDRGTCLGGCETCDNYKLANNLYEQGYRKIPENAVVLTREEYEKYKSAIWLTPKEYQQYRRFLVEWNCGEIKRVKQDDSKNGVVHLARRKNEANGYDIENDKLIYFSNLLDGYKHEFKDLQEICDEMNGLHKRFDSYEEQLTFWRGKAEQARKETAREILDKVYDFGQGFFIERSFMEEDELYGILDEVKKLFLNVVGIKE